jgi:hypothetical protein
MDQLDLIGLILFFILIYTPLAMIFLVLLNGVKELFIG